MKKRTNIKRMRKAIKDGKHVLDLPVESLSLRNARKLGALWQRLNPGRTL